MRILIADDEKYTREGIVSTIQWEKYGIDCIMQAEDGEEALEIAAWLQPEIVLTDVKMPKLNGIEFVEKLKEICTQSRILFMSSYVEIEYLKSAIRLSAIDYIQKPLNMASLEETLAKTVALVKKDRWHEENSARIKGMYTVMLTYRYGDAMFSGISEMLEIPDSINSFYCMILESDCNISEEIAKVIPRSKVFYTLGMRKAGTNVLLLGQKKGECFELHALIGSLLGMEGITCLSYDPVPQPTRQIWKAYQRAEMAMNRYFFHPEENCFAASEESIVESIDLEQINEFEVLVKNHSPNIMKWIWTFREKMREGNYLIEQVKSIYFAFLNLIIEWYPNLCHVIYVAHDEPLEQEELWQYMVNAGNINVLHNMLQEAIELCRQEDGANISGRYIRDAVQYIQNNYQDSGLSVAGIAEEVHLSTTYLNACFKKETGSTIRKYIIEYRMEQAKKMLKDNHYRAKEISTRCGFPDNGYFTKVFRKIEGMTPLEYRNQFFGNTENK